MLSDASPQNGLPLLQVPPEILDRIVWYLQTTELCNFRLTCKAAEQAVHFRFTSEFFTRKQFMVSEFSLKALRDISKSRFAGYLRHVHLSLDQIEEGANPHLRMTAENYTLYQQRMTEQTTLWTLGLVPRYLADAFSRLPNLETVALRDFNSRRRSRDGPNAQWRSYGAITIMEETGALPTANQVFGYGHPSLLERANVLFRAIIHGLGLANVRPKSIEVMERNGNLLQDSAFYMHPDFEDSYIPVLRNLQKLHLCIDVYWHSTPHAARPYHQQNLARFLKHCEGLEELRINGNRANHNQGSRQNLHLLMSWLASSEAKPLSELQSADISIDSQFVPGPVELPRLSNLSLGMMAITLNELVQLITRFAGSLQNFELWKLKLMANPGTDTAVDEKKQNLYIHLLKRLLAIPNLNLRHIKLGALQQMLYVSAMYKKVQAVEFTKDEKASTNDEEDAAVPVDPVPIKPPTNSSMEYTGPDWRHFVRHEMIPRLYIANQHLDVAGFAYSGESEDEEEDEGEDDEEDEDEEEEEDEGDDEQMGEVLN